MKKLKSRVHLHNYYLEGMAQIGKKIKLICKNREGYKIFIANKVILAGDNCYNKNCYGIFKS